MRKLNFTIMGLLIFGSLFVSTVTSEVKTVRIEDNYGITTSSSSSNSFSLGDGTQIKPTSGTFDDPLEIPMGDGSPFRNGTLDFELNQTFPWIVFKFYINETSPVVVTLKSGSTTIDESLYEIYYDVIDPFYNFIDFKSTHDFDLPMKSDFPASSIGYYVLSVGGYNLQYFDFNPGETLELTMTIEHHKKGELRSGESSQLIQSVAYSTIQSMNDFLGSSGYVNEIQAPIPNIGDLDPNDADFSKTIGLAVYGISKAAQYMAKAGNPNYNQAILISYWNLAYDLWFKAASSTLEDQNTLFYYRASESNPTDTLGSRDYVTYLSDNAYMLLALGELYWLSLFILDPTNDLDYDVTYDLNFLYNHFQELANSTIVMFEVGTGEFQERLSITDLNEVNAITSYVFDGTYYGGITYSDYVTLESYAILTEEYYWQGWLYGEPAVTDKFNDKRDDLLTFIETNLKKTSVDGVNLLSEGIFAKSYDTAGSTASHQVDLISNALYVSNLNTYAKEFGLTPFTNPTSDVYIGTNQLELLTHATNVMENVLRVFKSNVNGLLYDSVNATDFALSERIVSNIGNSVTVFALNRLGVNWELVQSLTPSGETTARTWKIRSILGSNSIFNQFLDKINLFMFSKYDDLSSQFIVNDNFAESNLLLSNTYSMAIISDLFPVEMSAITQQNLIVGNKGQLTLDLGQIATDGTWIWWDPFKPFKINAQITIPEFGFSKLLEVDLVTGFAGNQKIVLPFFYDIKKRGSYSVTIDLSTEGVVLLSQTIELTALGSAIPEFSLQKFSVTDDEFETDVSFIDENGLSVSSLQVEGSLGQTIANSKTNFGNKYIRTGRTDSSGKLELAFNVKDIVDDGLINLTEIYSRQNIPQFVSVKLYLNLTNADSFNLETRQYTLDVIIDLKRVNLRISPTNLELTQGTTDSFSFDVTALDQDQEPIPNAVIQYHINEAPTIQNQVFTDADGEATITFRDSDLFALSNLVYIINIDNETRSPARATLSLSFNAENYPNKTIAKNINIQPNNLVITANPVQVSIKEKTIFDREVQPIEIEVAVSDLFSRVVNAFVHLEWEDEKNYDIIDLNELGRHITPYTFNVDPSKLKAGHYIMKLVAEKDGITAVYNIEGVVPDGSLGLNQVQPKERPVIAVRTIVIESSTTEEVILSAMSVLGALLAAKGAGIGFNLLINLPKVKCPNCDEKISKNKAVCSHCGRDTGFKKGDPGNSNSSIPTDSGMQEPPAKNLDPES